MANHSRELPDYTHKLRCRRQGWGRVENVSPEDCPMGQNELTPRLAEAAARSAQLDWPIPGRDNSRRVLPGKPWMSRVVCGLQNRDLTRLEYRPGHARASAGKAVPLESPPVTVATAPTSGDVRDQQKQSTRRKSLGHRILQLTMADRHSDDFGIS
jgi:hypothetical protein